MIWLFGNFITSNIKCDGLSHCYQTLEITKSPGGWSLVLEKTFDFTERTIRKTTLQNTLQIHL